MLVGGFLNFGQRQASCFPLLPVCKLSYANRLLPSSYIRNTQK